MLNSERLKAAAIKAKERSKQARCDLIDAISSQVEDKFVEIMDNLDHIPCDATGVIFRFFNVTTTPGTYTIELNVSITFTSDNNASNAPTKLDRVILSSDMGLVIVDASGNNLGKEIFDKEDFSPEDVYFRTSTIGPIGFNEIFGAQEMSIDISGAVYL